MAEILKFMVRSYNISLFSTYLKIPSILIVLSQISPPYAHEISDSSDILLRVSKSDAKVRRWMFVSSSVPMSQFFMNN